MRLPPQLGQKPRPLQLHATTYRSWQVLHSHVPAYSQWVFRDISDNKYKGLLNTKGLLTFAGYKKDIFYHYKSLLQT
jgi:hypothetical protein